MSRSSLLTIRLSRFVAGEATSAARVTVFFARDSRFRLFSGGTPSYKNVSRYP